MRTISRLRGAAAAIGVIALAALLALPSLGALDRQTPSSALSKAERQFLAESQYYFEHGEQNPFIEAKEEAKAPEDFYLFSRIFSDGAPTREMRAAAGERARAIRASTKQQAPQLAANRWDFVGPTNIGARVTDLVIDPKLEDTLYVASASGGMWKSTDAGTTFEAIWPIDLPQAMGAVDIGSDGTLYAGTGETNPGGGSLTYGGDGVYKSTDRGKTWRHVGLEDSSTIGRILVDPKDSDHVLVAVSGDLFTPGGERGLYETKDGGATWKRILKPDNDTTGAVDVKMSPDGKNIYVAMWDHIRYPDRRVYTGPGSGIFRSTDGGKSFERLGVANGLPPAVNSIGRIGLGMDPNDPQRLYAIYANNELGAYQAWFTSPNGGDAWVAPPGQGTLGASQSVYGWWFARVWVDPNDSNHVFVAGLPLMESFDGGQTFPVTQFEQHVDHHAMAWDPHKKGRVYNGNDGGVYRSEENGADGSWIHGKYQPWSQFFTIDISEQDPSRINGGLQDQGSVRSWGGKDYNHYNGGDGVKNAINPADKQNVFACSQYGNCDRSDDGGNDMNGMAKEGVRNGWLTPIEFQPGNTDVMYWAGDVLNRSTNRGRDWEAISPDLGEGDAGGELNPLYAAHYGTVQAIGLNNAEPKTIYAGTDNGLLWKTTDLGASWSKIEDKSLPDRWITHVTVAPNDPDTLYVTFSGYRQGDNSAYVVKSTDGGKSFEDISGNLPKAPLNDIVLVDGRLYVASDVGVFTTKADGSRWFSVGKGLPLAPVNDLRYIAENDALYAGTFGRGIYAIEI